jgi:hypothetical protein
MALTGELSDLSLAELIEFFCNQRKSGCLKIIYPHGAGYFYLQAGSVVHARIGMLRGIDAVYSALTLPNASFTFSPLVEAPERSINQPWTQVVLEGLRRMDEGVIPGEAFPPGYAADPDEEELAPEASVAHEAHMSHLPEFLSGFGGDAASRRSKLVTAGVVTVIVLIVAVVGVPAGWYSKNKPVEMVTQTPSNVSPEKSDAVIPDVTTPAPAEAGAPDNAEHTNEAALLAARREREARDRERAKAREEKGQLSSVAPHTTAVPDASVDASKKPAGVPAGPRKVTVQVSYDENGRVTQASGGDATALRIARQKRFPSGKPGSATVTIPIN